MLRELRVKKIAANEEAGEWPRAWREKICFGRKSGPALEPGAERNAVGRGTALQVPKVNGQFPGGLIALRGILFETLGDNTFEFEGEVWIELARRNGKAMEYGVE